METVITPQQRREIFAWLRGDINPDPEMEDRFIDTLAGLVRTRLEDRQREIAERRRSYNPYQGRPHPLNLETIVKAAEEARTRQQEKKTDADRAIQQAHDPKTQSADEGVDSVAVAGAIVRMAESQRHLINMTQLQAILYIMYGVYLARTGKRLMMEHPQMWEYGPVFPRVYNRMRKSRTDCADLSDSLREQRPDIWEFVSESFSRYAWTAGSVLVAPHTASGSPWAKTRKKSPDKWGATIEDSDIAEWFSARM